MGNSHPKESNMGDRLRCIKCHKVLPPCPSFSDLCQKTIHGRYVHEFNGGQYYRPVGNNESYECADCFYKPIRDQEREQEMRQEEERRRREEARRREEEERKREEERRREEERKIEEEQQRQREAEEKKRKEELNQRLEESLQQAQKQHEKQLISDITEEHESKQQVLTSHLNEFETGNEPDSGSDDLLETLSSKCSIPITNLSLAQLTAEQLGSILSALDKLLFDEWLSAPPTLTTLQHTQVFISELCARSLEISEGVSLQRVSDHVQSLLESISQSAYNVCENLLLTQALYLTLMCFYTHHGSCDSDAALIAKLWAEEDLATEDLFLIEFLGTLTSSLQDTVEKASVFILKMEIECLKFLLYTLTHLNGKESHSESTAIVLRLVQTNQWTPAEAVTLLKALSEKYADEGAVTEVLTLVQVYNLSPEWTDGSGRSVIQSLDFLGPDRFLLDIQSTLRKQDESALDSALVELKTFRNLDNSVVDMIKRITTGALQSSKTASKTHSNRICLRAPKVKLFTEDPFERAKVNEGNIQKCLCQLCEAVFDTKGWWPTVQQMLSWCVLVLTERNKVPELVGVEEDPCITAMFAATQVFMGNKLDIVLSSDIHSHEQSKEWSDFYKHLGISLDTDIKKTNESQGDVYEADIVYGTLENVVSHYIQYGLEVMETEKPHLNRGFIIEETSLNTAHHLELSRLKGNDSLVFAVDILQSLVGNFNNADMELRSRFIKALFQVLHTSPNKCRDAAKKIKNILQKLGGKQLPSNEVYILSVLENLIKVFTAQKESDNYETSVIGKVCAENLFACAVQFQASKEQTKELFQIVSNLVAQQLWSPVEALNLLVALTDHHHDEQCISIMKILHLMEMYQVSSEWTDVKNKSILKLLNSSKTENLIHYLEKSFRDEKEKSIDCLFDEIQQMKNIDKQTLETSYHIVKAVQNMITSGNIKKHKDVQKARNLSHSKDTEDLQEILAVLCNAVHLCKAEGKWWPRATQMISWCLLALSDTGKLLEMGTGEGKSCVVAMFAVLRALRGEKVDVVSCSSVLCERDAQEWTNFYSYFGITADTNTNKTEDKDRRECYQKDVVYGTIEAFAADHLRQIFEMKDVRPDRSFQCIIIDEVDSLLLDQGVQLTYLSSPMVSMQHLNIILAMIWGHVSQYGFLSTGHQTFIRGPPASFFRAIFDSIDTEGTDINDPMDILFIAEESKIVPKGFTQDIYKSEKDELLSKLKTISQDAVVHFFQEIEQYVPYDFTVYTLDDNGLLSLRKSSTYNNRDIPDLTFLVLEGGLCCTLYDSEEILIRPIAELTSDKIQYTPCQNTEGKISMPGFLRNLIEKKVSVWVGNAFLAMRLRQGREYVVENDSVCPVDFRSTGTVEQSKKWGDGLQQFVEMKHQIKLSTVSTVTNYISNLSFFEKYRGKIYGTTGTLGSDAEIMFLKDQYPNLSVCRMPTFNRKKLFEVEGTLTTSAEKWKSEIKRVVMAQISPNSYRDGRAALVICETINTAKEIYEELKSIISGEAILYSRNDKDSLSKIDKELCPGDVIVATNLAGRGTDIKVSKQVNNSGGLFVILSFLSENTRVELQAFGRTARKGKPGSAQVIMTTDHLQDSFRTVSSLEEAKRTRDRLAAERINDTRNDVTEMKLREDLFSEYCETLQDIHRNTDGDEKRAVVAIMNEFWGIWLQIKSDEIDQLKRNELQKSLIADLSQAKIQSQSQASPCSSIYHYIRFGNIALDEKQWDSSTRLFEKAMEQDESWAAIAFYSHAYCTIKQQKGDYLSKAIDDLRKAQESLKYFSEECIICLQLVKMSSADSANSNPTSLEKQFASKCSMLSYFDKNISEAIQKLEEIKQRGKDAIAKNSSMFSLVSGADEDLQVEAYNLYSRGLKYVFSVEEQPYFPWGALGVFFLGVLQIVGGALLTAFTFGTLAQVGMGLITEGLSDCIYGIESMVTGEFSWKSWAIEKAISIGISLLGFGVGKLLAKGFKACKTVIKGIGKHLKSMPKFFSSQVKEGLSVVAKTNMKNAVKHTAKSVVQEIIMYGFGKAEQALLTEILNSIKNEVKKGINDEVTSNMEKEPLAALVDSIILSHLEDKQHFSDLLQDEDRKKKLLDIFRELSNSALQPFYEDLSWQNKLNSSISSVIRRVKSEARGKARAILTAIQVFHIGSLASDAIAAMLGLSNKFFSNLHEELNEFKKQKGLPDNVKRNNLSASETLMLRECKHDLADIIGTLLADGLVEVFHQKFSSHVVSEVQDKVNGMLCKYVRTGLKSDRTEEKLRAGQNNRYIAHMPVEPTSKNKQAGDSVERSQSHAEKIRKPTIAGTILDIRVLSETTGIKVVILTQDSHGKLTKMQEVNPGTKPASQTVTLIYRPKSAQYPDGHYDVLINNKTEIVTSEDKSCLFHALAKGMKPQAGAEEINLEANRLRSVEADSILRDPSHWEAFIKHKEWTERIRGGDWYMAEGGAPGLEETEELLRKYVDKVQLYKTWKRDASNTEGIGQIINADHQPPVNSILRANELNQNSKLATAMLEVATNPSPLNSDAIDKVKKYHGLELPTVYVPREVHLEFPSTKSKAFRELVAKTISQDDVSGAFKLTILGAMPRFMLDDSRGYKNFQNPEISRTRLEVFQESFPEHSKTLVNTWFNLLEGKTDVMTHEIKQEIHDWIDRNKYHDQNDPYRKKVIRRIKQRKRKRNIQNSTESVSSDEQQ